MVKVLNIGLYDINLISHFNYSVRQILSFPFVELKLPLHDGNGRHKIDKILPTHMKSLCVFFYVN